jgi:hypothetical protein
MLATRMARMGRAELNLQERIALQFALQNADCLHHKRNFQRCNTLNIFDFMLDLQARHSRQTKLYKPLICKRKKPDDLCCFGLGATFGVRTLNTSNRHPALSSLACLVTSLTMNMR